MYKKSPIASDPGQAGSGKKAHPSRHAEAGGEKFIVRELDCGARIIEAGPGLDPGRARRLVEEKMARIGRLGLNLDPEAAWIDGDLACPSKGHGFVWPYGWEGVRPAIELTEKRLWIWIVRTEAEVDLLWEHGALAICDPDHAGWKSDDYRDFLKGLDLAIVAPRVFREGDESEALAATLSTIARQIKVVRPPKLEENRTLCDWFQDGFNVQNLCAAHELAAIWGPKSVVRADQVVEKDIDWLWQDRIPRGFLTIFAGRTGVGKSFVAFDIVARVTRGLEWPDRPGERADVGNALIFSEDPHASILTPRLRTLGADLSRVHYVTWDAMAGYELADTDMLDEIVQEAGDPTLIIIDPPTNFLGNTDENSNVQVRKVLMKLVKWVDTRTKPIAVIMITQVNKGGKDTAAIDRIISSIAWAATSRIAHVFAPDKDVPNGGFFSCPKTNLGERPKTLKYHFVKVGEQAKIEWDGESDKDADEVMQGSTKKTASDKAVDWITERFRERRDWPSDDIRDLAVKDEISTRELFKGAKVKALPFRKEQRYDHETGERSWFWTANEGWPS